MENVPTVPESSNFGATKPKNYLVENIVSTAIGLLCCCGANAITGIIGIVFATQVDSKFAIADYAGAESAAKTAKLMFYITAGLVALGLIINVVSFFILGGGVMQEILKNKGNF